MVQEIRQKLKIKIKRRKPDCVGLSRIAAAIRFPPHQNAQQPRRRQPVILFSIFH